MSNIISQILDYSIKEKASDIHLSEGLALTFRIEGKLKTFPESTIISSEKIKIILNELFLGNKKYIDDFLINRDADFSYTNSDSTSFRVNGFFKIGKISFILRRIEKEPLSIEKLGLPSGVGKIPLLKQGLVLVTGPTGSGKSTTMVALLEQINKTRKEHIITIEDPIEFVFKNNQCIFSQRELGKDTKSFYNALRACMREDPDIIMVGEMRDKQTVQAALELAETGHLVISTLHTSSATQTIVRLLSFFPLETQNAVSEKIASSLQAIISQRLIPKANGESRVGIYELLISNTGILNQIRMGKLNQIQSSIETGSKDGMITMKAFCENLEEKGIIKKEDYINYFSEDNF